MPGGTATEAEHAGASARLRLVATTDLHMQIRPFDYLADAPAPGQGLACAATVARAARADAENALLFDVGDAFQGDAVEPHAAAEGALAMARALAAAGVEAATIGNHDFNHGLPALEAALAACPFPVVLANIVRRRGATPLDDAPFLPPFAVLERDILCRDGRRRPLRLGVIGVAPPQTLDWDADKLAGRLEARGIVETVAAWLPEIARKGADLTIVLAHSGLGGAGHDARTEQAAVPLAGLDGVDAVLAGHAHALFPDPGFVPAPDAAGAIDGDAGRVHGTPVAMPGFWGRQVGLVDLDLVAETDTASGRRWRVAQGTAGLRTSHGAPPDAAVLAASEAHDAATRRALAQPAGRLGARLTSYFSLVADCPVTRLVNAAQTAAVRAALAGRPEAALPILSANAPQKAGGLHGPDHYVDLPAGPLARRHVAALYGYPNTLQAVLITGAQLRAWLERSASFYRQVAPGARDACLIDRRKPGYTLDVISGVTYRIDVSRPPAFTDAGAPVPGAAGRITDLRCGGRAVTDEDRFVLATNSYRLGGQAGFPRIASDAMLAPDLGPCREAVARFLAAGGGEAPGAPPVWGFVPLPGTTVRFPTGPGARALVPEVAEADDSPILVPTGERADGFDLWRLDLARADRLGPGAAAVHLPVA
jgi:2',3'-cyclic-nucleotide 2'-phosphodiesterase/3'-nucleotidase